MILQKVNVNEERLDRIISVTGGMDLDDSSNHEFIEEVTVLPIKSEADFMAVNEKLNSDAVFRNKFVSIILKALMNIIMYLIFPYSAGKVPAGAL